MNKKKKDVEEGKILGPTGIKIWKYLKMKPVGGKIPEEKYSEWEFHKHQCIRVGLKVSDEGMLDMLTTHNKLTRVFYPMANGLGYNPVDFKNMMVDVFVNAIQDLDDKKWKKESVDLRNEIVEGIEMAFTNKLTN